ncbi:hypothetical protein [Kribbella sp. NPDC050470]|uniref:hypothetical protein n=1 Tax=unclassified Kribbella TaxID=2644121 RepID=UPI00379D09CE
MNGATGTYDMGFREYNPSLNRSSPETCSPGRCRTWRSARTRGTPLHVNLIGRIELDGHINESLTSGGAGAIVIGTGPCEHHDDIGRRTQPVGQETWKNLLMGGIEGTRATGEQLPVGNAVTTVRKLAGVPSDSQIYHNLVQNQGANTGSTAYEVGRWFGPW